MHTSSIDSSLNSEPVLNGEDFYDILNESSNSESIISSSTDRGSV